jgi:hypothetical protein
MGNAARLGRRPRDFTTPEEFAAFTASELLAWRKVIRAVDIRAE